MGRLRRTWAFSHNDEMHGDEALKLALSVGCGGIEVDTWLGPSKESVLAASDGSDVTTNEDMVLYAGHDMEDIAKGRTLQKLYLDPIMERLNRHNKGCEGDDWVGLYQADPRAEVMIAIDMKQDGPAIWTHLVALLQPFLEKGYLTTYDSATKSWHRGPLIIVGTGVTPYELVQTQNPRFIFFDGPLLSLSDPTLPNGDCQLPGSSTALSQLGPEEVPMASGPFPPQFRSIIEDQDASMEHAIQTLRHFAEKAKEMGIEPRFWGLPSETLEQRRRGWTLLQAAGLNWINADELQELTDWLHRR